MRTGHFEAIGPVCPSCRAVGREPLPLAIHQRIEVDGDWIEEGSLVCVEPRCQSEFPVLSGIPYIVPNVSSVLAGQLDVVTRRRSLSEFSESLLGDVAGPESSSERARYQVSSYARSHYGDLDPHRPLPRERTLKNVIDVALEALHGSEKKSEAAPDDLWLDLGCGPGRSSFELAEATGARVLGIDLNVGMLEAALGALRGRLSHQLRRVGLVYDRCDFAVDFPAHKRVDFWACDILALPFPEGLFRGALSLNVLDCVASPLGHLRELGRALADGARTAIASPFDWSTSATPLEGWIGGHSGRAAHRGKSEIELGRLLSAGDPANAQTGLVADAGGRDVDWEVYVHERASMRYRVHVLGATRSLRAPS